MKKIILIKAVVMMVIITTLVSCKKDDDSQNSGGTNNNASTIPTSIVANWEVSGPNLPTQSMRDNYSKVTFSVAASNAYSIKYYKKNGDVTDFVGTITYSKTTQKHTNNTFIYQITINVQTINGQSAPGGWKGIFAFETGNILKLDMEPNVNGVTAPTPSGGFGSGSSGKDAVYNFVKK